MLQPNELVKVFISSTFSDLVEHREAVHTAIHQMKHHADDMIYWSADERTPTTASVENVKQSNLMILIVAHRYGSLAPGDGRSFTEVEYDAASKNGVPVFAFFVDPLHPWPPNHIEVNEALREKLLTFRQRVETECVRQFFTTPESLAMMVTQAIANFDKRSKHTPTAEPREPARLLVL